MLLNRSNNMKCKLLKLLRSKYTIKFIPAQQLYLLLYHDEIRYQTNKLDHCIIERRNRILALGRNKYAKYGKQIKIL